MPRTRVAKVRVVLANGGVGSIVSAHLLAVIAEYASIVGVLVYAFERGGARTTGFASLAILTPALIGAPVAAVLLTNIRPLLVRRLGLLVQAAGYASAAAAAAAGAPVGVVVACTVMALGAVSTLRPTGAVLLPAVVRSTSELTTGNLGVSYCENAGALLGPLAAAVLLSSGGPAAVLAGCAVCAAAAVIFSTIGVAGGPPAAVAVTSWRPGRGFAHGVELVRQRRWVRGVLGVVLGRYIILGALDVILVVLAYDALELGRSGAGLLNALVGGGAMASALAATVVVRRRRLAPSLAVGLLAAALLCALLGTATSLPVAVVVLPLLGCAASLVDGLGRMLLQRSADPRALGAVFALVELVGGIGLLLGSGLAQLLIAVGDVELALYGLGAALATVLLATARSVWRADAHADVPVVEMSLLRGLPMFASSTPLALEAVARSAEHIAVPSGAVVVTQGERGDRFYAVARGRFEIVMSGELMRVAERGSFFGEVALLADLPRTATVTAREDGELLAVDRVPFLIAVTGSDTSRSAAWGAVRALHLEVELPTEPSLQLPS